MRTRIGWQLSLKMKIVVVLLSLYLLGGGNLTTSKTIATSFRELLYGQTFIPSSYQFKYQVLFYLGMKYLLGT
jgi:hypothetical protein